MSKKIKFPAILIAHDLLSGRAIYWAKTQWQDDFANAQIAHDETEADILETIAAEQIAQNKVVDAELVSIEIREAKIIPDHFRVKIKFSGPTIEYGAL